MLVVWRDDEATFLERSIHEPVLYRLGEVLLSQIESYINPSLGQSGFVPHLKVVTEKKIERRWVVNDPHQEADL